VTTRTYKAQNNYDLEAEYSRSILDVPHRVIIAPIVELPFGKGKRWANQGNVADALAGGWMVSAIIGFESGFPVAITQSTDTTGTFSGSQRPNVTGTDPTTTGGREDRFDNWINPAAYSLAAPYTYGTAPRTDPRVRTPDRNNADVVISKDFRLTSGGTRAQLRFEFLNINNHVKTNGPEQRLGLSSFGQITAQAGFMRITQVTFRISF
jgi:hypothetical protein